MAYKAELAELEGAAHSAEIERIRQRLNRYRSPYRAAEIVDVEEVIDPRETRPLRCRWANLVAPTRRPGRVTWSFRP